MDAAGPAPIPRTAVPMALNSSPPSGNEPKLSLTPTIPCPPSAAHSAVIRPIAVRLASYIALVSGPYEAQPPCPDTCVAAATAPPNMPVDQPPAQP